MTTGDRGGLLGSYGGSWKLGAVSAVFPLLILIVGGGPTLAGGRWGAFAGVLGVAVVAWLVIGAWVLMRRAMRLDIHERAVVFERLGRERVVTLADVRQVRPQGTAQDISCVSLHLRDGGALDLEGFEQMREIASLLQRAHAQPAPSAPAATGWVAPTSSSVPAAPSAHGGAPSASGSLLAGDLAARLRLQLVAGQPSFDFGNPLASRSHGGLVVGSRETLVESRLEGAPDDYPTRLSYLYRMEQRVESGLTSKSLHSASVFECRFSVWTRAPFPSFEVVSRAPTVSTAPIQRQLSLPLCPTGHPAIDTHYQIFAADPAVAAALAPLLPHFDPFASSGGVQIIGEKGTVSFAMFETQSPMMASVLYQPELLQRSMTVLARGLGG